MQREWIHVLAERGDDERHPLRHQSGDERDVAGKPVELGHGNLALGLLRCLQRRFQLRTAIERIGTLAGLDLGELGDDLETFGLRKGGNSVALRFETKTTAPLRCGRNAMICDERLHWRLPYDIRTTAGS